MKVVFFWVPPDGLNKYRITGHRQEIKTRMKHWCDMKEPKEEEAPSMQPIHQLLR